MLPKLESVTLQVYGHTTFPSALTLDSVYRAGLLWESCLRNLCTIYLRSWKTESNKKISWGCFSLRALNATLGIRSYPWLLLIVSLRSESHIHSIFQKQSDDPHVLSTQNETLRQSCWNGDTPCCSWSCGQTWEVVHVVMYQVRSVSNQASKIRRYFYFCFSGLQYHLCSTSHWVNNDGKAMD